MNGHPVDHLDRFHILFQEAHLHVEKYPNEQISDNYGSGRHFIRINIRENR